MVKLEGEISRTSARNEIRARLALPSTGGVVSLIFTVPSWSIPAIAVFDARGTTFTDRMTFLLR